MLKSTIEKLGRREKQLLNVTIIRSCNYDCSYCNQRFDLEKPRADMSETKRVIVDNKIRPAAQWIAGLNNFPYKDQFDAMCISGGEASLHPGFYDIVAGVKGFKKKIVVTNLSFDIDRLLRTIDPNDKTLEIQPSFHFEEADFNVFLEKMKTLEARGLLSKTIPTSIVDLPDREEPKMYQQKFREHGFEVPIYMFEGYYKGKFNSVYADVEGFGSRHKHDTILCSAQITEVKATGDIMYCPTDAYLKDSIVYGNMCDQTYKPIPNCRDCGRYGMCHVASAAWIQVRNRETKEKIFQGKNYRKTGLTATTKKVMSQLVGKV